MTESLAQQLLDHVLAGASSNFRGHCDFSAGGSCCAGSIPSRLSVIGLCKNAGKTVTLNHLIRAAAARSLPLGLVSTGRDGEEQDAITELPKPHIWAPAGAWVATARGALSAGTAQVKIERELPLSTPFGPVVLGRVEQAGEVLLIGPGNVRRIGEVLSATEGYGARLSLVDGSFDRIAAAAPTVTGRVVLAAGAAYSTSMAETVAQVRHVLDIFDLPTLAAAESDAPASVIGSNQVIPVSVTSALGDPEPIVDALEATESGYLALNGALGDRLLAALLRRRPPMLGVVINDATRVLVERNLWRRWRRQGGQAFVRRPVQLLAITTNAYSPVSKGYDAHDFHQSIRELANRPVFDLEAGLPQ